MYNSRKTADGLDFTFAEVAHLVGIEGLPGIVLDEPDTRENLEGGMSSVLNGHKSGDEPTSLCMRTL